MEKIYPQIVQSGWENNDTEWFLMEEPNKDGKIVYRVRRAPKASNMEIFYREYETLEKAKEFFRVKVSMANIKENIKYV